MPWSFKGDAPIYIQLLDELKLRIVTGAYPPGSRIESVRELANEAAVNPNTMQRALAELEKQGLVHSQRTSGRFITDDQEQIMRLREALAREKAGKFIEEMEKLGYTKQEAAVFLEEEVK